MRPGQGPAQTSASAQGPTDGRTDAETVRRFLALLDPLVPELREYVHELVRRLAWASQDLGDDAVKVIVAVAHQQAVRWKDRR